MTPTQINKAIRAGQIFYVKDPLAKPPKNELIVERAKTITNKSGLRRVKVETMIGWLFATEVRRAGSFEPITLDGEGPMTRQTRPACGWTNTTPSGRRAGRR